MKQIKQFLFGRWQPDLKCFTAPCLGYWLLPDPRCTKATHRIPCWLILINLLTYAVHHHSATMLKNISNTNDVFTHYYCNANMVLIRDKKLENLISNVEGMFINTAEKVLRKTRKHMESTVKNRKIRNKKWLSCQ